jgi:hypothetical protein
MSKFTIKSLRWLAPVALVGTLGLAACGDEDATVSAETADVGAAVGSDRHLENLAAEIAERSEVNGSDRHLENLAAEIAEQSEASGSDSGPNAWEAGNRAAAERLSRADR